MKITILVINILILAVLAFFIYKLVKEQWEHLQILEEKVEALMALANKQTAINDNTLSFEKSQIEMNKILNDRLDELALVQRNLNLAAKSDRDKLNQFDDILAQHMMDEMNTEVIKGNSNNEVL